MADGHIEPVRFTDEPQLLLTAAGSRSLLVLPGSITELRIHVGLRAFDKPSDITVGETQARLAGEFSVRRETPTD